MSLSSFYTFLFLFAILRTRCTLASNATRPHRQLSVDYYAYTCPHVEELIGSVTSQRFNESPVSGPATIRLFFHDCFVEGCDGSVLVSTRPGSKEPAERDAQDNKDLRNEAYGSITKAKALVETKCPGVVSCADILAISARDFVHLEAYKRELEAEKAKGATVNEDDLFYKAVGGNKHGEVYGTGATKELYYGSTSGSSVCSGSQLGKSVHVKVTELEETVKTQQAEQSKMRAEMERYRGLYEQIVAAIASGSLANFRPPQPQEEEEA